MHLSSETENIKVKHASDFWSNHYHFHFCQFTQLEASYAAEVPEVTLAPNLMPLFRRQYDNSIFTGNLSYKRPVTSTVSCFILITLCWE